LNRQEPQYNNRMHQVFHLTNQADNDINLKIANTNLTIANSSAKVAEETQKDSASMITIAAVTMFFLPGTFVCAIFSTVFFNVGQDTSGSESFWVSQRWWYYLVVTVPLTVLVFVVWLLWREKRMRKHEKETGKERSPAAWYCC
jgi:magnesium-transporting ATPase (P-type)